MKRTLLLICNYFLLTFFVGGFSNAQSNEVVAADVTPSKTIKTTEQKQDKYVADLFFSLLLQPDRVNVSATLQQIESNWKISYIPFALETIRFTQIARVKKKLSKLVEQSIKKSGARQKFESDNLSANLQKYYYWLWNQEIPIADEYFAFKADLYQNIDPKFSAYFRDRAQIADIRLDEVQWGGVEQDGIPPLRQPKMLAAAEANYLKDEHIVFGIEINGDSRAYPKRILAWHEMFTDKIGGVEIASVYCTLCGAVIPYRTEHGGKNYQLGTSGFLYRSNKLMYDQATQSLWSTTRGTPVLGPLVDADITLERESVVTTTWGEWRRRHPQTTVLSLDTGHQRNYDEGAAYSEYFATDRLMFNTQLKDTRLKNKQEILALRFASSPDKQLAIATTFLLKNPFYAGILGKQNFIVLTDQSGANRVFDPGNVMFTAYDRNRMLIDSDGKEWMQYESWLESEDGRRIRKLPYHRAFWFGWVAAYPGTELVK